MKKKEMISKTISSRDTKYSQNSCAKNLPLNCFRTRKRERERETKGALFLKPKEEESGSKDKPRSHRSKEKKDFTKKSPLSLTTKNAELLFSRYLSLPANRQDRKKHTSKSEKKDTKKEAC